MLQCAISFLPIKRPTNYLGSTPVVHPTLVQFEGHGLTREPQHPPGVVRENPIDLRRPRRSGHKCQSRNQDPIRHILQPSLDSYAGGVPHLDASSWVKDEEVVGLTLPALCSGWGEREDIA